MIQKDHKCLKLVYEWKVNNSSSEDLTNGN